MPIFSNTLLHDIHRGRMEYKFEYNVTRSLVSKFNLTATHHVNFITNGAATYNDGKETHKATSTEVLTIDDHSNLPADVLKRRLKCINLALPKGVKAAEVRQLYATHFIPYIQKCIDERN